MLVSIYIKNDFDGQEDIVIKAFVRMEHNLLHLYLISRIRFLILFGMFLPITLCAQRTEKWCGEYKYYASTNDSPEYAKQRALEETQIHAAEELFGLSVTQTNLVNVNNNNGDSKVDFTSISGCDVNGEWIETIGKPEYDIIIENEFQVVNVKACGRVREIVSSPVDFKAKLLRNGVEDKYEDAHFRNEDDLFMSFLSPVAGHLAVYLLDDKGEAYCLLPYSNMQDGIFKIMANERYLLFSKKHPSLGIASSIVEELYMTCDKDVEHNQFYIIFSPNKFTKVSDNSGGLDAETNRILPRHLDNASFQKWLAKCRKHDKEMRVDKRIISISK